MLSHLKNELKAQQCRGIFRALLRALLVTSVLSLGLAGPAQHSAAREWNEELLEAIRNGFARPTVHARNLFHTAIGMWDAWAAYDSAALNYIHQEKATVAEVASARREAISYSSYRILSARFANSPGASVSLPSFDAKMAELGYDMDFTGVTGDSPAALGNRIAATVLAFGATDGANEKNDYSNRFYQPRNPPFLPAIAGNPNIVDPNLWQPLSLKFFVGQSGIPSPLGVPPFVSPEWGQVTPFALAPDDLTIYERGGYEYWVYLDPGPPPMIGGIGDTNYRSGFEQVVEWSGRLDPTDGVMIDVSPNARGNNRLGTNDGNGHEVNPITGLPYLPQIVPAGDYYRVLAEFWADGPDSETPPGHWFTIANYVSDHPLVVKRFAGTGPPLNDLEWDVKLYFSLGGAVHDAAVAAWGAKGWHDYIRPISAIRYMGAAGQGSDPNGPSYHPDGISLKPGVIEVITQDTVAAGERHEHLAGPINENLGKIAVKTWRGPDFVSNPAAAAGVGWILAERWWPYQRPTFVTPPFAGYVSGHSTFSRAAAELMTRFTGDAFFPGGLGEFFAARNEFLVFENGPSVDITLQWATYRDASDETSISRIYGGIHPTADDIPGRLMGARIGRNAFQLATRFFLSEEADSDGDGVKDLVEEAAPNGGDNNQDGVSDSRQAYVASLPDRLTSRYVSLVVDRPLALTKVRTAAMPETLPRPGVVFPLGLFNLTVEGVAEASTATVDLLLPPREGAETYFKYGPTPADPNPHWYEFIEDGTTGAEISGDTVRLNFVDGERGDDVLVTDGKVVELGGPARLSSFFFPQLADGSTFPIQFKSTLILVNTGFDSRVQIEFFANPDGQPLEVTLGSLGTDSRFEVELRRGDSISLPTLGNGDLRVGYARVLSGEGVSGVVIFTRIDQATGVLLFETGVPASTLLTEFSIAVNSTGSRDTGLAIVYPADEEAPDAIVTLRLFDQEFNLIAEKELDPLAAGSHLARFVHQLFDDEDVVSRAQEMKGLLTLESDRPLAAVTLRQKDAAALEFPEEVPLLTVFPVVPGTPDSD